LVSVYGTLPLRRFSTALVDQLQTDLINKGYEKSSNNKVLNILKHMFAKAVEWEMVEEEVLKRIRKVKPLKGENKRLRYLSKEECKALIYACNTHLEPVVITAMNTGMRRGEILNLKWENVDLKHGFILLDKTKNGERREIPINKTLEAIFLDIGFVRRIDTPYVFFDSKTGNPYQELKRSFHSALKKATVQKCTGCNYERAVEEDRKTGKDEVCPLCSSEVIAYKGIKDFHFHDLRHTFASHLVMSGVDITTVSKLLGHKSLSMTLRYSHLAPSHMVKAVDILDQTLNEKTISTKFAQFGS
jgi:integrase